VIYLIAAYVAAVIILGGFLWLSLSHLHALSSRAPAKK
jgi:hypothetical protein